MDYGGPPSRSWWPAAAFSETPQQPVRDSSQQASMLATPLELVHFQQPEAAAQNYGTGQPCIDDGVTELRWTETTIMADIRPTKVVQEQLITSTSVPPDFQQQYQPYSDPEPSKLASPESITPTLDTLTITSQTDPMQELHLMYAAVFLTEASREMLLLLVPPLHTIVQADHMMVKLNPRDGDVVDMPVGAEVALQVTGVAADHTTQAVSVIPPAWLKHPDSSTPHISVSSCAPKDKDHGGRLVAEGLAGTCYHQLTEPFLLYGRLGLATTQHQILYSAQEYLMRPRARAPQLVEQTGPRTTLAGPRSAGGGSSSQGQSRDEAVPGGWRELAGPNPGPSPAGRRYPPSPQQPKEEQQQLQKVPTPAESNNESLWPALQPSVSASRTAASGVGSKSKAAGGAMKLSLKSFLSAEATGKAPVSAGPPIWLAKKTKPRSKDGSALDATAFAPLQGAVNRLCWLHDLGLGDYAEVAPLDQATGHPQADSGDDGEQVELAQGFVEEILMDEEYQPKGVLVRLHDNTMGYAARLLARRGPDAAAAAAAYARRIREKQEGSDGGIFAGQSTVQSRTSAAAAPLDAPSPEAGATATAAAGGDGNNTTKTNPCSNEEEDALASQWQEYRQQFGDAISLAVLEDCNGDMKQAVETLHSQAMLLGTESMAAMDQLVARAVNQAHAAASTSLAAQQQEDEQRRAAKHASRAAASLHKSTANGDVDPPVVGKVYKSTADDDLESVSARGTSGRAQPLRRFPLLDNTGCRTGRGPGLLLHQQQTNDWQRPERGVSIKEVLGSAPATASQPKHGSAQPLKLLRRPDSLATAAAQAGIKIGSAEALKKLLPGYSSKAIVEAMVKSQGDVNSAADFLLASGPPTETEEAAAAVAAVVVSLCDSSSSSSDAEDSQGSSYFQQPASSSSSYTTFADLAAKGTSTSEKVSQLVASFEGLDRSLADYLLKQCGGDVQRTSRYILEEVLGKTQSNPTQRSTPAKVSGMSSTSGSSSKINTSLESARPAAQGTRTMAGSSNQKWELVPPRNKTTPKHRLMGFQQPFVGSANTDTARLNARLQSDQARRVAQVYYDARNVFFQRAAAAYSTGDGRMAAEFSKKGKEMTRLAHQHRDIANEAAYRSSNVSIRNQYVMDLHFMFVEEALGVLRRTLATLQALDSPKGLMLKVITGAGHHSASNVPVIKKAVTAYLKEQALQHFVDPTNDGVVCVQLGAK